MEKNRLLIENKPIVLHCHHYNTFLQRTLEDALGEAMIDIQINAAAEETYELLQSVFSSSAVNGESQTADAIFRYAEELYRKMGLGIIDFSSLTVPINDHSSIKSPVSHYAIAWLEKWGSHEHPVCHFTAGFIKAVIASAHQEPLSEFKVEEVKCIVMKNDVCEFKIVRRK